ncbi:ADP,ATP carrier protein [Alphaproteobacteria bacterium]
MSQTPSSMWNKLFPVHVHEFPKFIYTSLMIMFTIYVYSILRVTKDTLLLSALGPELISTTKLWSVFPSAVIFMLVYTKLANVATRTTIYHGLLWFFIGFFVIFTLFLYPNLNSLMINVDGAVKAMPYMKYLLLMISGWPVVLFYVLSELWGSVMMALMFWQLANQITAVTESKRFYPLFLLIGQGGMLLSGTLSQLFSDETGQIDWQACLNKITVTLVISGFAISLCLILLCKIVGKDNINNIMKGASSKAGKKKVRLGFVDSLKYIFSSKYIGLITLLILCYGISINLVEGIWKASVNMNFAGNKGAMQSFFGSVQVYTGIFGIVAMYGGSYLLNIMRWRTGAMLTPIMVLVTGILFYIFIIYREGGIIAPMIAALGSTPLYLAVVFGASQNVLSKSVKYAFFDATKEISYIPLDEELKSKGKAAADVIGGRLGKSMGAGVQWGMLQVGFMFNPDVSLVGLAPYFFAIFVVVLVIWMMAVCSLEKEFNNKIEENKKTEAEVAEDMVVQEAKVS